MPDKEEELEITRGPLKGKKVRLASREITESFEYELEEILDVIGHPEALITDCSSISDFFGNDKDDALHDRMLRIGNAFGIDVVDPEERLVDLAERARTARKGKGMR